MEYPIRVLSSSVSGIVSSFRSIHKNTFLLISLNFLIIFSLFSTGFIFNSFSKPTKTLAAGTAPYQKVYTWGEDSYGSLADGTAAYSTVPVQVQGLTGSFSQVSVGAYTVLLLGTDGTVWSWGNNGEGQLGIGTVDNNSHPTPQQIPNLNHVIKVFESNGTSYALKSDGTMWTWGANTYGSIGNGDYTTCNNYFTSPSEVQNSTGTGPLTNVIQIAGTGYVSIALTADGKLWTWGDNNNGELGNGTYSKAGGCNSLPTQASISDVKSIFTMNAEIEALKADGTLWTWGDNLDGELGINSAETCSGGFSCITTPTQIPNLANITNVSMGKVSVSGGASSTLISESDGSVWYTNAATIPALETAFTSGVVGVSQGWEGTSYAIKTDGSLWAWGYCDYAGEFGNGSTANVNTTSNDAVLVSNLTNVGAVEAGYNFAVALSN